MPTKPNGSGEQQEYVPKGTPDGGEYTYNDYSSTGKSNDGIEYRIKPARDYSKSLKRFEGFSEKYKNTLSKALDKLDDNEAKLFSTMTERLTSIKNGDGQFEGYGDINIIKTPDDGTSPLDKELGYDRKMTTLFHEYGHYLDRQMGKAQGLVKWSSSAEVSPEYFNDMQDLSRLIFKEQGIQGELNLARITLSQKDAIIKWAQDKSGVSKTLNPKTEKDFVRLEPRKPFQYPIYTGVEFEKEVRTDMWYGYDRSTAEKRVNETNLRHKQYNDAVMQKYNAEMKQWSQYTQTPEYKNGLKAWQKYQAEMKTIKDNVAVSSQRFGFMSDFIGSMTAGRIDCYRNGMWGHSAEYHRNSSRGSEIWAEYCSFKLTKDNKGLDLFKQYLPRTFGKFEQQYKKMEGILI